MSARLELSAVTKRFGGLEALRDVSLAIEPGSLVAVTGPNGAGKTTLLDIITGRERPTAGTVRLDGRPITGLPPHRIAWLGIGRTFQIAHLFPDLSALDNVLVGVTFGSGRRGDRRELRQRAARLLETVGLSVRAGLPAGALSLGEQKRLELAVALGPEPRLLLLDELTSGLSPRDRDAMIRLYASLSARGLTVVAIEHAFGALTELAGRALVLDRGEVVADGAPRTVFASRSVIERYLGEEE